MNCKMAYLVISVIHIIKLSGRKWLFSCRMVRLKETRCWPHVWRVKKSSFSLTVTYQSMLDFRWLVPKPFMSSLSAIRTGIWSYLLNLAKSLLFLWSILKLKSFILLIQPMIRCCRHEISMRWQNFHCRWSSWSPLLFQWKTSLGCTLGRSRCCSYLGPQYSRRAFWYSST